MSDSTYGKGSVCCKASNCNETVMKWLITFMMLLVTCKGEFFYPEDVREELERGFARLSNMFRLSLLNPMFDPHRYIYTKFKPCFTKSSTSNLIMKECGLKNKDSKYVALILDIEDCIKVYGYHRCDTAVLVTCDSKMYSCMEKVKKTILSIDEFVERLGVSLQVNDDLISPRSSQKRDTRS